jgi:hypothetical protein
MAPQAECGHRRTSINTAQVSSAHLVSIGLNGQWMQVPTWAQSSWRISLSPFMYASRTSRRKKIAFPQPETPISSRPVSRQFLLVRGPEKTGSEIQRHREDNGSNQTHDVP